MMKEKFLYILLFNCIFLDIYGQIKNDTIMIERYNYEATEGGKKTVSFKQGEWIIDVFAMPGGVQLEYAPSKDFYMIQKRYHENGVISSKGKLLGNVPFGVWEYFDENGNLTKEVDEDAKFGKIKPKDIIRIMEEVGWINRESGKSITSKTIIETDGNFYRTLFFLSNERNFQIYFSPAQFSEKGEEIKPPLWSFGYLKGITEITYIVNGNTGKYERTEKQLNLIE